MNFKSVALFIILFSSSFCTYSQNYKLVIDDQIKLIDDNSKVKIKERLKEKNIEWTDQLNYSERCQYWYVSLLKSGSGNIMIIKDCKQKVLNSKELDAMLNELGPIEKSIILSSNIHDLVTKANNIKEPVVSNPKEIKPEDNASNEPIVDEKEYFGKKKNEHDTRYFFSPSAFPLRKGEAYYNNAEIAANDIQLGISDRFSVGMGTSFILNPLYISPKMSFKANETLRFAVGDLFMWNTFEQEMLGNLAYVNVTKGNSNKNFTVSAAAFSTQKGTFPLFNFGAMAQFSKHLYFVTEHYYTTIQSEKTIYGQVDPNTFYNNYLDIDVDRTVILGTFGIRYVHKNIDTRAWQFGLGYFGYRDAKIDEAKFRALGYTEGLSQDMSFFIIPTIAYTHKLGIKI